MRNDCKLTRRGVMNLGAAAFAPKPTAAPAAVTAIGRCARYDATVLGTLRVMLDQIGGIGRLVAGKTVALKINMTGPPRARTQFLPAWRTHWTHPAVIGAAVHLIGRAGAKRIHILEGSCYDDHPLEENFVLGGWDPDDLLSASANVRMVNTGCLGSAQRYERLNVAGGGLIFPAFDFHPAYTECDVLVSIAKLKEHRKTGVSLSIKNLVGAVPAAVYGDAAGFDAPAARPYGAMTMFHTGNRQPPEGTPAEKDPNSPRQHGYRVPRIAVDIVKARPIDLAIVDGIETQTGAEAALTEEDKGPEIRVVGPGILIAGRNALSVDAVAMTAMGFDALAGRGAAPFENCDSTLRLAEEAGLGSRDPRKIEIVGQRIESVRFPFRARLQSSR